MRTVRAGNDDGLPEAGAGRVTPFPPNQLPSSPAGGSRPPSRPTQATPHRDSDGVSAGDPDWFRKDAHDNYILALQVIGGKVPHPGRT